MIEEKTDRWLAGVCWFALALMIVVLLGWVVATIPAEQTCSSLPLTDDGFSDWSPCWCMHRADTDMGLVSGWNLIGICSNETRWASSLASGIDGCSIVSCFDSSQQSYTSFFVGGPDSFDFPLARGMGVFVLVEV